MRKKYPAYGTKTDYPKINILVKSPKTYGAWLYYMSTTWARTCKQAKEHFNELPACSVYGSDSQFRFVRAK